MSDPAPADIPTLVDEVEQAMAALESAIVAACPGGDEHDYHPRKDRSAYCCPHCRFTPYGQRIED